MRISTQLLISFVVSSLLFVAVVVANYQLSGRVLTIAQRVSNSQHVTGRGHQLYRHMVDMESGYRGFLLTGREESLEPYYNGQRALPDLLDEMRSLLGPESPQQARLKLIQAQFAVWQHYSQDLISQKRSALRLNPTQAGLDGLPSAPQVQELVGKRMMDKVRQAMAKFEEHENRRRASQAEKLSEAIADNRAISVLLTVSGVGLGLVGSVLVIRTLSRRISRQVTWAERLADGDYTARVSDTAGDELTQLSQALDRMAETLTTSIAQLESRNRELDQFAYIVSHDLKAPLRGIESVSRWIEEDYSREGTPPHIQEFLLLMRRRVHRMESLISGILALSRVGRAVETHERVDVAPLLTELLDDLAPPPGLTIRLPDSLPILWTTRTHLMQVFQNLLSNAIKYHDHAHNGLVAVTWRTNATHHVFAVTDDGPGIAPEYHERIFQIFQTLQERDSVESTGVGLTIVQKIVERHGGTISVASAEGRGATFTFTWPLSELPPLTAMPAPSPG